MTNATIGMVECPLSGEPAAVRKDKSNRFYYISVAGRIAPSADFGQDWFINNAIFWHDRAPPGDVPDWIVQGKSFPPASASRQRGERKHSPLPQPAIAPAETATAPAPDRIDAPVPAAKPEPRNPWSLFGADDDDA